MTKIQIEAREDAAWCARMLQQNRAPRAILSIVPSATVSCDYCDEPRAAHDTMPAGGQEVICRVCAPGTLAARDADNAREDAFHLRARLLRAA